MCPTYLPEARVRSSPSIGVSFVADDQSALSELSATSRRDTSRNPLPNPTFVGDNLNHLALSELSAKRRCRFKG